MLLCKKPDIKNKENNMFSIILNVRPFGDSLGLFAHGPVARYVDYQMIGVFIFICIAYFVDSMNTFFAAFFAETDQL